MEEDFGVGVRAKDNTIGSHPITELAEIVNLAVEDNGEPAIGRGHRLMPGRTEVKD